jgi:hypothetical protein
MVQEINKPTLYNGYQVGWPKSSRYRRRNGGTIGTAMVAKHLEFGFNNLLVGGDSGTDVPERPFFRNSNRAFITTLRSELRVIQGNLKTRVPSIANLNKLGKAHADRVRLEIETAYTKPNEYPINEESTIKRKGHPFVLTETGQMARDVTYEIVRKV